MKSNIYIPVPAEVVEDPNADFNYVTYFEKYVDRELAPALDKDVWEFDDRAKTYETEITDVEVDGDAVCVHYSVMFDAHYGCSDQNWAGDDSRYVTGTRVGDHWVFQPYAPRERRSTYEEF
jgi:hypothetical protein